MQWILIFCLFFLFEVLPASSQTFWREVNSTPFAATINTCVAVHPTTDDLFVGTASLGIFRSVDAGTTWQNVYQTDSTIFSLFIRSDGVMIAGGRGCVYRSADNGATWSQHRFAGSHPVADVLFLPDGAILLGTGEIEDRDETGVDVGDGVFLSQDGGVTWTKKNNGLVGSLAVTALAQMHSGRLIAAMSNWNDRPFTGGIYYSDDEGAHWQFHHLLIDGKNVVPDSIDVHSIDAMIVDDQDRLLISMRGVGYAWNASSSPSCEFVAASSDMGETWEILSIVQAGKFWMQTTARSMYIDQMGGMWCSTFGGGARGIFYSSDNGVRWQQQISGLFRSRTGAYEKVFFAHQADGALYAVQEYDSRIYRSDSLVTEVQEPLPGMISLSVMPNPIRGESTVVRFFLNRRATIRLTLTDIAGAEQVVVPTGEYAPGEQILPLHLEHYVSGAYQLALEVDGVTVGTTMCRVMR